MGLVKTGILLVGGTVIGIVAYNHFGLIGAVFTAIIVFLVMTSRG